ncbi:MAG TPA: SNF2-related protein [Polyangiales bacterium]|nr:SNF2-related protein [Polyangiales bacterium]
MDHILQQMVDREWATLKAALEALTRRHGFAVRTAWLSRRHYKPQSLFRTYRTRSQQDKQRAPRPYETALLSLSPLRMSCGCADFVRSSLGLCKHCLLVLEALHAHSGEKRWRTPASPTIETSTLAWDSYQSPLASSDRLERLRLLEPARRSPLQGWRDGRLLARTLRSPEPRLSVIRGLQKLIERGRLEAEPAVHTLLAEEHTRAARVQEHVRAVSDAMRSLRTLKRRLYPYQRAGVQRFFGAGPLLLADDMGLGKTTQAIAACHGLFEVGRVRRGLLLVPAALKGQWRREWESATGVPLMLDPQTARTSHHRLSRRVRAMVLFDAVDRALGIDTAEIPSNVERVVHARRDPYAFSRNSFGNCGVRWHAPTKYELKYFRGTHGAVGGVPWQTPKGSKSTEAIKERGEATPTSSKWLTRTAGPERVRTDLAQLRRRTFWTRPEPHAG